MTDIIAKLDAAPKGSRKLSNQVLLACGWTTDDQRAIECFAHWDAAGHIYWLPPKGEAHRFKARKRSMFGCYESFRWDDHSKRKHESWHYMPDPTRSTDDALTLMPEGWFPRIAQLQNERWMADVVPEGGGDADYRSEANYPALALCSVVLMAREQSHE